MNAPRKYSMETNHTYLGFNVLHKYRCFQSHQYGYYLYKPSEFQYPIQSSPPNIQQETHFDSNTPQHCATYCSVHTVGLDFHSETNTTIDDNLGSHWIYAPLISLNERFADIYY